MRQLFTVLFLPQFESSKEFGTEAGKMIGVDHGKETRCDRIITYFNLIKH